MKLRLRGVYSLTSCKDLMLCGGYEEQTPLKQFFSTKSMACLSELGWCPPCLILLLHSAFPTLGHHLPSLLPLEYLHLDLFLQQDDVIHTSTIVQYNCILNVTCDSQVLNNSKCQHGPTFYYCRVA
jgi:hypothetical protein